MTVYIQEHTAGAGNWIYTGYKHAWESMGYNVVFFKSNINPTGDYYVMITDSEAPPHLNLITNSKQCFLYTQPNDFPEPWGTHPNFQCHCPDEVIAKLNDMTNVKKWTFGDCTTEPIYTKWKNVNSVPLAFDNIAYKSIKVDYKYDVCFIGGIADNGFNEKIHIMNNTLGAISRTELECGFFINKNLTHTQENYILNASKITINIHDAYQRALGLDTNERTFKSLGVNGMLVSDKITQLDRLFPFVKTSNNNDELVSFIQDLTNDSTLEAQKEENKKYILSNHTYIHRAQQLLSI
jgi:hypothetical protein